MPTADRMPLRDKVRILDPRLNDQDEISQDWNKVMEWLKEVEMSTPETTWRIEAAEDYKFYAGDQDTAEVKAALDNARRANSTFNDIKSKVDMLIGLAAQVKYDGYVIPTGVEDEALAELMEGTLLHYRKKLKMGRKELDCFEHTAKSGRSMLYFRIDSSNPFKKKISPARIPGSNFAVDPVSVEYDMSDAKYFFVWSWVDEDDLKGIDPDIEPTLLSNQTNTDFGAPSFYDNIINKYRIVTCWYRKWVMKYWIVNPFSGQQEVLDKRQYQAFNKAALQGIEGPDGQVLKVDSNIPYWKGYGITYKYMTFSGDYVIDAGVSPHNEKVEFPAVLYGGFKDDDNNRWFGAVTAMKDPQRAINVMLRQMTFLLQTLPKGILVHEVGAILDVENYEKNSANPNYHMEVGEGKIEKVKFEKQPSISPVYQQIFEIMKVSMKDVSGIRDDLLGAYTASREPGVTVSLRKESNLAVLFILFNNYRESRLEGNRKLMYLIQQYVTDEEVIRIQGEKGAQLIAINNQLNPQVQGWNDITAGEFDLEMEETVETGSFRTAIAEMLVDLNQNNPGMIPPDIIMEYMNIPFTTKRKIKEFWEAQRQLEQENKDADRALEVMKIKGKLLQPKAKTATPSNRKK